MFAFFKRLCAAVTCIADRVIQKVLSCFGRDRQSIKIAAERQVVGIARTDLASLRGNDYATSLRAELALQGYRSLYQQVTLPSIRQGLLAPTDLRIIPVGHTWRIMDQAAARSIREGDGRRKDRSHKKRLASAHLVRSIR